VTKKHFIALADAIREHNRIVYLGEGFDIDQIDTLADFCKSQNSQFDKDRWMGYIAGECGPSGGKK